MIVADRRAAERTRAKSGLALAALLSFFLHTVVLASLLPWFGRSPVAEVPQTEGAVELVMLEQQGTAPAEPEPAPPAPAPAPPQEPQAKEEPLPSPTPPAPPTAAPVSEPVPPVQRVPEAPEINIGGNDSDTNAMVIAGPNVIPASIDATYRNREPVYPLEAVRRAEQGAVILLIHVSPDGLTAGVDVAQSSGFVVLDRAAEDAVWNWHFLPAVRNGRPIPFDMKLRVVFHLQ